MLTEEQKGKYLAIKGMRCPYCGGSNLAIYTGEISSSGATCHQDCYCMSCGSNWTNVYTLTDVKEA